MRMLRAIKFAARLDFGFEPATWRALLRWRSEISKCAPPRLLEEMHRLLRGGAARRSFELMVETGVLAVLSPYLAGLLEGPGAPTKRAADRSRRAALDGRAARVRRGRSGRARSRRSPTRNGRARGADAPSAAKPKATSSTTKSERGIACGPTSRRRAPRTRRAVKLSFLAGAGELAKRRELAWARARADRPRDRGGSRSVECGRVRRAARAVRALDELRGDELQAAIHELSRSADQPAPRHAARQRAPALPAGRAAQARRRAPQARRARPSSPAAAS